MRRTILFNQVKGVRLQILFIVFSLSCADACLSQPAIWIGSGTDTLSDNPASWSGGVLPTATSDIIIPDGAAPLYITSNTNWSSVTFLGGNQATRMTCAPTIFLTITGNITIEDAAASRDIKIYSFVNCAAIVGGTNTGGSGNRITMFPDGDLTISGDVSGCDLVMVGPTVARFSGNFTGGTVCAPYNSGEVPVIDFDSPDPQTVPAGTYGLIAFTGGGDKTLAGPITVTSEASFNNGIVINSSSSPIFFDGSFGGLPSVTSGSDLSYATGPVRWLRLVAAGPFTFPVGKKGAGYHPATVDPQLVAPTDFTVEYIRSSGAALGPVTAPGILKVSGCEYWDITRTTGGVTAITLTWNSNSGCGGTYIADLSSIRAVHFNGTSWDDAGGVGGNGTPASGSVAWSGVANFSPFTIGTTSALNTLPVELTEFSASPCGNSICLYWKTASENNNDHFEIEESADARQFNLIGRVNGNGTTSIPHNYTFSDDHTLNGKNYYRLRQVDGDGRFTYSKTIMVMLENTSGVYLYPNPLSDQGNLIIHSKKKGEVQYRILNNAGRLISAKTVIYSEGTTTLPISTGNLANGLYYLELKGTEINKRISFIKQ